MLNDEQEAIPHVYEVIEKLHQYPVDSTTKPKVDEDPYIQQTDVYAVVEHQEPPSPAPTTSSYVEIIEYDISSNRNQGLSESTYDDTVNRNSPPHLEDNEPPVPPPRFQSCSNQPSVLSPRSPSYNSQPPVSPPYSYIKPRSPSYDTSHPHVHGVANVPMESAYRLSAVPKRSDRPPLNLPDMNLQFSYDDLSREQLIQAIQMSQSTYPQPNWQLQSNFAMQGTSNPLSVSPNSTRSEIYVNVMTDDFSKVVDDRDVPPPPLPPRSKTKSSGIICQAPAAHQYRSSAGVSKSQSVLLHGTSAEARRQRYRYQGTTERKPKVKFELAENDGYDGYISGARVTAQNEAEAEGCPPVPPRLHRKLVAGSHDNYLIEERSQNIVKRSHTMRAYLPSETRYQRKYMSHDTVQHAEDNDIASGRVGDGGYPATSEYYQPTRKEPLTKMPAFEHYRATENESRRISVPNPSGQISSATNEMSHQLKTNYPNAEEVRAMLGMLIPESLSLHVGNY